MPFVNPTRRLLVTACAASFPRELGLSPPYGVQRVWSAMPAEPQWIMCVARTRHGAEPLDLRDLVQGVAERLEGTVRQGAREEGFEPVSFPVPCSFQPGEVMRRYEPFPLDALALHAAMLLVVLPHAAIELGAAADRERCVLQVWLPRLEPGTELQLAAQRALTFWGRPATWERMTTKMRRQMAAVVARVPSSSPL